MPGHGSRLSWHKPLLLGNLLAAIDGLARKASMVALLLRRRLRHKFLHRLRFCGPDLSRGLKLLLLIRSSMECTKMKRLLTIVDDQAVRRAALNLFIIYFYDAVALQLDHLLPLLADCHCVVLDEVLLFQCGAEAFQVARLAANWQAASRVVYILIWIRLECVSGLLDEHLRTLAAADALLCAAGHAPYHKLLSIQRVLN